MKKRIKYIFSGILLAGMLMGCSVQGQQEAVAEESPRLIVADEEQSQEPMRELFEDPYGDYQEDGGEIAFVSDGTIMDGGYNEAIYEGIRTYALAAGISFSYYNAEEDNLEGHLESMEYAILNHAQIVVCAGYDFRQSVAELQDRYPEVSFLLIDGVPEDMDGNQVEICDNVHCVSFREEESGYLAGYLAVLEGYRRLGFIGGKEEPSVIRYGYGFLQGVDDAAKEMGIKDVAVKYWYGGTFQPEEEIFQKAQRWYAEGTEVIFACGGFLWKSVLEAAVKESGMVIGADIDQCDQSEHFLTSAVKDIANAVVISLDNYYAAGRKWTEEFAGQSVQYGMEDHCTGIPVSGTKWRFRNVTMEKYFEIYTQIKQGKIIVSDEAGGKPKTSVLVEYMGEDDSCTINRGK